MSSIDERIVILTFDNKQFESNVETSLGTLDRLKKSLNLEESAKGLSAISASAKSFDLSGIGSAIEDIKGRFSTLGIAGMTVVQELTKTFMGLGEKLISSIAGPLTQGGWKRALNIEQATFQMEGLLGKSAEGAEKLEGIMGAVKESVMGTAYGADEAARVASVLVASGKEDATQMLTYLRSIAGAAAMTGRDFQDIGDIFSTIAGQGVVMTQQLRQFEHSGLNVAGTLAKQWGITEAEVRDMVTSQEITFEMFAEGLNKAFGEHATRANETFTGSLKNLKAALARIGEEVAAPSLKNLHDIFISLRALVDAVHVALKPLIERLNEFLGISTKGLVEFIDGLTEKVKLMTGQVDKGFEGLDSASARAEKFATRAKQAFGIVTEEEEKLAETTEETAEAVVKSSDEIEEAANRVIAGEFGNGEELRREQLEALGLSFEEVQNRVNEMLGCEYRYEVATVEAAEATAELVEEAEKAADATEKLGEETEKTASPMKNFAEGLSTMAASLFKIGSSIVGAFKEVFSGTFKSALLRVSEGFKNLAERLAISDKAADGLKTVFKGLFTVLKLILTGVGKVLGVISRFIGLIGSGIGKVLEFFGALDATNKAFDETSRKAQLIQAIGNAISRVGEAFDQFKIKVKELITAISQSAAFAAFKDTLKNVIDVLKEFGGNVVDKVIEFFNNIGNNKPDFSWLEFLGEAFSKLTFNISEFVKSILRGENPLAGFYASLIPSDEGSVLEKILNFLKKIKDTIVDFFTNFDLKLPNFKGFFDPILNFIMPVKGNIFSERGNFVSNLVNFIKGIYEKLKTVDLKYLLIQAKDITLIILQLLTAYKAMKLVDSMRNMFDSVSTALENLTNPFQQTADQKFRNFAIGIALLAGALWVLSKIPKKDLQDAVAVLVIVSAGLAAFSALMKYLNLGDAMKDFGTAMLKFGGGLVLLAAGLKLLSLLSEETFITAAERLLEITIILAGASRLAGKSSFGTLVGMALAVDLIVPGLWALGHMKESTIKQGAEAIFYVTMTLGLASRLAGRSSFGTLIGMSLAVLIVSNTLKKLGEMPIEDMKQGAIGIAAIAASIGTACLMASAAKGTAKVFLAVALTIVAAATALFVLSRIDFDSLKMSALALGGVMVAISAAVAIASKLGNAGGVAALLLVLTSLVIAFKVLESIDIGKMHKIAVSLSLVALALSASLLLLVPVGAAAELAIGGIGVFDLFLVNLSAVLVGLGKLETETGGAFGQLISVGAGVFGKLGEGLGKFVGGIIGGIGEGITNSLPDIADNLSLFGEKIQPFMTSLEGITESTVNSVKNLAAAVLIMCGAEFVDGIATFFGLGKSSVVQFGESIAELAPYLVDFSDEVKNVDAASVEGAANAALLLAKFAQEIPNEGGRLASWIGDNTLAQFAVGLVPFAHAISKYSRTVKAGKIDEEAVEASTKAGELITKFASTIENQGGILAKWVGDNTLALFADGLLPFAHAIVKYSRTVKAGKIDEEAIEASTKAGEMITKFASTIENQGGILAEWVGDNTLSLFAEGLIPFAHAISKYSRTVKAGKIDTEAVEASTKAGELITGFAATIENQGGFLAAWVGDNTLSMFAKELNNFAPAIVDYSNTVKDVSITAVAGSTFAARMVASFYEEVKDIMGGALTQLFDGNPLRKLALELAAFGPSIATYSESVASVDAKSVETSINAGKLLAGFYSSVKDTIGIGWDQFIDGSPLSALGKELAAFGPLISKYSSSVQNVSSESVSASAAAGELLAGFYAAVKDLIGGGWKQLIDGSPLSSLGEELVAFGPMLSTYSDSVSGLNTTKVNAISNTMIDSVLPMTEVANDASYNKLDDYGKALKAFGGYLKDYNTNVSGVNTTKVSQVVDVVYELIDVASAMSVVDTEAMGKFGTELENCGKVGVEGFIAAFENSVSETYDAGSKLVESAADGAESSSSYNTWYNIGANAVEGLMAGIDSLYYSCYNAGYDIGEAAYLGAQNALMIASPSKKMRELGIFADEGLINGLEKLESKVLDTGYTLGDSVLDSIAKPLSKIQDVINSDVDLEPVITPVLDLDNINQGVDALNGMTRNRQVSVLGNYNLGTVNNLESIRELASEMAKSNFGDNTDVVEALTVMRQDIMGLGEAISKMQIRLDGKALVGEIIEPIDNQLGERWDLAARGVY